MPAGPHSWLLHLLMRPFVLVFRKLTQGVTVDVEEAPLG